MRASPAVRHIAACAPLAAALIVFLPALSAAQAPAPPPAGARDQPGRFFALDIFGGYAKGDGTLEAPATGEDPVKVDGEGWEIGATVLYGKRWLGIKSTVGRATFADVPVWQVAVGPQVYIGKFGARWLAHALVGVAATSGQAPSQSGVMWAVGGGLDLFVFRMQADYVALNLDGLPKRYARVFVGAVLPLCFRACEGYMEDLSSFGR